MIVFSSFLCAPSWIVVKNTDCSRIIFKLGKYSCSAMEKSWKVHWVWKRWVAESYTVTKSLLADCVCLVLFLIESLLCCEEEALSSVTPQWPFLMPYWPLVQPAGSDLCPGKAISAFCHGWERCVTLVKWHKSVPGSCVLLSESFCLGLAKHAFCLAVTAERLRCRSGERAVSHICSAASTYQWLYCTCTVLDYNSVWSLYLICYEWVVTQLEKRDTHLYNLKLY